MAPSTAFRALLTPRPSAIGQPAPRFTGYASDPVTIARRLLGQRLVRIFDGERLAGTIVEVEAYLGSEDRAAHTWAGRRTPRNESMYLPGGHAYVYFTYGMHYCLNVVCGEKDEGVAVLLRALEPVEGHESMAIARPRARSIAQLCSGPAKLTQALRIDRDLDGENLLTSEQLFIEQVSRRSLADRSLGISARIGVDYAGEWAARPLRFFVLGNPYVSRPPRRGSRHAR
jgi:DNA-3-methyladenine glycosylase